MCMEKEIWKPVKGYEELYEVSNYGRVKSLRYNKILKTCINKYGYERVSLHDGKSHDKTVHRLVACAFIPNPYNLPQINHKDENKLNNCVDNLEWCTNSYNLNYGHRLEKAIEKKKVHILQFTKDMDFVCYHNSIVDAASSVNGLASNICSCCKQTIKRAYGYVWRYAD